MAEFNTLMFFEDDYTFHEAAFKAMIDEHYDCDQQFPDLTAYYRK